MLEQCEKAVAQQIARRLMTSKQQHRTLSEQFLGRDDSSIFLGANEQAHQILAQVTAAFGQDGAEIFVHCDEACLRTTR